MSSFQVKECEELEKSSSDLAFKLKQAELIVQQVRLHQTPLPTMSGLVLGN